MNFPPYLHLCATQPKFSNYHGSNQLDNSRQRMLRRHGLNGKFKMITKYVQDIDNILPKNF